MNLLNHPKEFTDGTRVLFLKGRHKDGILIEKATLRVSHSSEEFYRKLKELADNSEPNERIYASAGRRNLKSAIRLFKERQLSADYDADVTDFYRSLNTRWISCLMNPRCQEEKYWLFDCDSNGDEILVIEQLGENYNISYNYRSKSGTHILVKPFDKSKLSDRVRSLLHDNAIILWGF